MPCSTTQIMDKRDNESLAWVADAIHYVKLPDERHRHETNKQNKSHGWTDRQTFALMMILGQCISFMNSGCLSVAIVAMVSSSSNSTHGEKEYGDVCPVPPGANDTTSPEKEGEFDWDEQLQGVVLGSFFYGYASSCFVGGLLTDYFGGRLMFGASITGLCLLSVLSPISARTSVGLFIANKVISGLMQGPLYPSINSLMASRIPSHLRAKYNSICLAGGMFGNVISMALGGLLASSSFLGGWPSVFYVFGTAGILWGILWFLLIQEDPSNVIMRDTIHSQNRNQNGLLSSLPYLLQIFFSISWGMGINRLIISGRISVLASRRISSAVGMHGAGLSLVAMCFVNCNSSLAVAVLCIAVALTGASFSGGYLGEQDMCPPSLVGVITGLGSMVSATTGFIAPLVVGSITLENQTLSAWRMAFLITATVYFICGTFYQIFVTEKVQPWIKSKTNAESNKF
ncbi:putative inorganic phosphate cotransporter isoform X2 [Macrobrachium rosenbergii]|uniref:putative inorganic phosphate cotransporter isoform X2 n=1 Tax=Macrobrachium rosenbergii TaxID=79674 RepID=UPI0034D4136D